MVENKFYQYDLLIVSNDIKMMFLKEMDTSNSLFSVKFMSLPEFIKKVTYSYDEKAIFYVMKEYHVKYEIAKEYLENSYYIEEKEYAYSKLNFLVSLKKELEEKNLLIKDSIFKHALSNKKVGIYGYPFLEPYEKKILEENKVAIMSEEFSISENSIPYYEFQKQEQEIDFLANSIISLLEEGIPLAKIKLMNVTKEDYHMLRKIFSFYHIPITIPNDQMIYGTSLAHFIMEHLEEERENLKQLVEETFSLEKEWNLKLWNQILSILNKYSWCENLLDVKDLIVEDFRRTPIPIPSLKESVQVVSLKECIQKDDYVFLMGCNQGVLSKIEKEEDFLSDAMKKEVHLFTSTQKNKQMVEEALFYLKRISNLVITSRYETTMNQYLPSSILSLLNVEKKETNFFHRKHYSKLYDQIKLASKLDQFQKYGVIDENLKTYFANYPQVSYQKYDNQFTGVSSIQLFHRINQELKLSYTSLDSYHRCAFRYYVSRILKCDPYEETFSLFIGNLFHNLLSKAFKEDFEFEKEWNQYLENSNREFTYQEQFFLGRLKKELLFDIETIKEQNENISFDHTLYEEKVTVPLKASIPAQINGVIDKAYYKTLENGETLFSVVDYKTGTLHTNLNQTIYGINMQLPIYLYLLKRHFTLQQVKVVGFYLQKILNNEPNITDKNTREELKKKALRLVGYSTMNVKNLKMFDESYEDSKLITGMKTGKNGFYATAKVLTDEKIEKLDSLVSEKIQDGVNNILSGNFKINPKVIGIENVGCMNCTYRDICYMKEKDKVYLKEYKKLEFLEEE